MHSPCGNVHYLFTELFVLGELVKFQLSSESVRVDGYCHHFSKYTSYILSGDES